MSFTYKLQKNPETKEIDSVFKFFTGTDRALSIPFNEANSDYQAYLLWVSEGNTAEAAD